MNDADFEMLARDGLTSMIARGVKPYTLPDETWLRVRALELAVECGAKSASSVATNMMYQTYTNVAQKFYEFLKGESSENLRRQD
jgi:hypothetical protein